MAQNKRFVVDTNALLSSLFLKGSTTYKAMGKVKSNGVFIFSNDTFLEFETVLFKKKFDKYFSK